jgi:hypothetical protein
MGKQKTPRLSMTRRDALKAGAAGVAITSAIGIGAK